MRHWAGVVALAVAAACGGSTASPGDGTVRVVGASFPIAEAAERIGGDRVIVVDLTPPGGEPHDLEPTPEQIQAVAEADVVFWIGGGFQPAVERLATRRSSGSVNLVSGNDPHVWLDPVAWRDAAGEIAESLSEADPAGAASYAANATAYRAELSAIDADYRAGLRDCASRVLVTAHRAFGALAARYGLELHAIAGLSPEGEPSPARLAELRRLVRERGVTTIFTEPLAPARIAGALARETGAAVATLDPIESREATGRPRTFLALMLENLAAIRKALRCR